MKNLKMLAASVLAAAALMAMGGSALGATLTSPAGTTYTTTITANSEGHLLLKGSFGVEVECNSHVKGKVGTHGGSVITGPIEELSFTNCTNGYSATVLTKGSLSINSAGEVKGLNNEVTVTTPLGINCTYHTAGVGTKLGTLTDTADTGGTPTIDLNATIPRTGHAFLCGTSGIWTGSYTVSTPMEMWLD